MAFLTEESILIAQLRFVREYLGDSDYANLKNIEPEEKFLGAITVKQIKMLESEGFYVEDMEAVYGSDFKGQFRWVHDEGNIFQDDETSDSRMEAWIRLINMLPSYATSYDAALKGGKS